MKSAIQDGIIVNFLTVQNKDYMASRKGMVQLWEDVWLCQSL